MTQQNTPAWWHSNQPIRLPVLSKNIHLLLQVLSEEYLDYPKLAKEISYYPTITARLICLANSSWSAPSMPIADVETACTRLGASVVRSVSIAMVIANSFDHGRCHGFDVERFWLTSMLVAEGAVMLYAKLPKVMQKDFTDRTAHTAGVLHIIGLLWLADNLPQETSQAFSRISLEENIGLNSALQQIINTDYCMVGGWIGTEWNMPEVLVHAMQYHCDESFNGEYWDIAQLIGVVAQMVALIIRQVEETPVIKGCARLQISNVDQDLVYKQLAAKMEKTLELSRLLFG